MKSISLIIYDFDGIMTDNKVYIDQNGNETVQVNRADGLGVAEIKKLGLQQIIVSTEMNPVVSVRAKKLNLPYLQGVENKSFAISKFCKQKKISMNNVAYVGNDINDYEAMKIVGTTFCSADAHQKIKQISHHVLMSKGGEGVVREILDILTRKK
ncbi:HAD hydrolase family protein [Verrucomicrobia bacterium]|nr:HAD hydrolase family protein [Verrucomicrobiota bacterium]